MFARYRTSAWGTLALLLIAGPAALAPAGDAAGYYRMYFDRPLPLALDPGRIAVQVLPATEFSSMTALLAAYGLDPEQLEPRAVPRWATLPTPAASRDSAGVEALVAALAESGDIAFASPVFLDSRGLPLLITADLLIGFRPDVPSSVADALVATYVDGTILDRNLGGLTNVYRVRSTARSGFVVLDLANSLTSLPEVSFAESDAIVQAELSLVPNDPLFSQQWGLNQASDQDMDLPETWELTTGDPSVIVVVMDCGIQQDHPDLHQIPGQDFTQHGTVGGGPYNECDDHATCVAGCVSAVINNSIGVVGVAPDCVVASAKMGTVISFLGFCTPFMDSQASYVVNALGWAVSIGARVTNSSFGYTESAALTTAYNNAYNNGIVNVAAAGNSGTAEISYPASLSSVIAVAALSSSGARASFSQYGPGLAFCAPGEGILTTDRTGANGYESGDYATVDGTSFSSPNTAGVAALVISQKLSLTPAEVEDVLNQTCVDLGPAGYDTGYGWGFVNAHQAVLAVTDSVLQGDMNCDGEVNNADIPAFVLALTDRGQYTLDYPDCDADLHGDFDGNGELNNGDIPGFVELLTGG